MASTVSFKAPGPRLDPPLTSLSHRWFKDPASSYEALAPTAPVRHFSSLVPLRDYYQFVGHLPLNGAYLTSFGSAEVVFSVEACSKVHLVACAGGTRRVRTPRGEVEAAAGAAYLLAAGEREASGSCSNAICTLGPKEIGAAAAAMAGRGPGCEGPPSQRWGSFPPQSWAAGSPQARQIHALVAYIDACAAVDSILPARLGLDDLLYRQVAALLDPSLLEENPAQRECLGTRQGRSAFDNLIDHIRANLHQPLRLSDLEARSRYSRRALQYAFREKLQCTPMRWIRQQRLEKARERLLSADGSVPSLQALALECGYRSQSHFTADFRRYFGQLPSQVRRESH